MHCTSQGKCCNDIPGGLDVSYIILRCNAQLINTFYRAGLVNQENQEGMGQKVIRYALGKIL